jgi:hypothetical protein
MSTYSQIIITFLGRWCFLKTSFQLYGLELGRLATVVLPMQGLLPHPARGRNVYLAATMLVGPLRKTAAHATTAVEVFNAGKY